MGIFLHLKGLVSHRTRFFEGVRIDLRQQYSGSALGTFWAVLFPIFQLGIFAALYAVIFRVRPTGLTEWGYVLLVFSGLVPLLAFNAFVTAAAGSLATNKSVLLNAVFPSELIPLRAGIAAHVPNVSGLILTIVLAVGLGHASPSILYVSLLWALLILFSSGIGLILSLITLVAKDVQQILGLVLMLTTVLSPFAYTPDMVPTSLKFIILLNPLSYFVVCFQQVVVYGTAPDSIPFAVATFLGLGGFLFGFYAFIKAKFIFFDYA